MYFGESAESFNAPRSRATALLSPWSKSTKVSVGQSFCRSSSRDTASPCLSSNSANTWKGCSCSLILRSSLRSSPARRSTANLAKRTVEFDEPACAIQRYCRGRSLPPLPRCMWVNIRIPPDRRRTLAKCRFQSRLARYQLVFEACALVHCSSFRFLAQSATQLEWICSLTASTGLFHIRKPSPVLKKGE